MIDRFPVGSSLRATLVVVLLGLACSLTANAQAPVIEWTLKDALKQIERQAKDFKTAMARVEVIRRDPQGSETSRGSGNAFFNDDGKIRYDVDEQGRTILIERNRVSIFSAAEGQVEQYSLSRHKDRLEPFLRLGFSTTGKELNDGYLLTSLGEEMIGESRTLGIEMTPKKEKIRETVGKVRLSIDQASWMPTRQEITDTQAGNTLVVTYTRMARNLKLNPDLFKAKWPRGTKKVNR